MRFDVPDLKGLAKLQAELDKLIKDTQGIEYDTSSLNIIAFKVEFGEFLNEHKFFKHWKVPENRKPNTFETYKYENPNNPGKYIHSSRNPLLGEYVDGIFFLLSIGNERGYMKWAHGLFDFIMDGDNLEYLAHDIFNNPLNSAGKWKECLENYLAFGHVVGIKASDIHKAYLEKHKINRERQATGY